jgi:hypothetical protein
MIPRPVQTPSTRREVAWVDRKLVKRALFMGI